MSLELSATYFQLQKLQVQNRRSLFSPEAFPLIPQLPRAYPVFFGFAVCRDLYTGNGEYDILFVAPCVCNILNMKLVAT